MEVCSRLSSTGVRSTSSSGAGAISASISSTSSFGRSRMAVRAACGDPSMNCCPFSRRGPRRISTMLNSAAMGVGAQMSGPILGHQASGRDSGGPRGPPDGEAACPARGRPSRRHQSRRNRHRLLRGLRLDTGRGRGHDALRAIELDGPYCDVIVHRWQAMTGGEAILRSLPARLLRMSRQCARGEAEQSLPSDAARSGPRHTVPRRPQ